MTGQQAGDGGHLLCSSLVALLIAENLAFAGPLDRVLEVLRGMYVYHFLLDSQTLS